MAKKKVTNYYIQTLKSEANPDWPSSWNVVASTTSKDKALQLFKDYTYSRNNPG